MGCMKMGDKIAFSCLQLMKKEQIFHPNSPNRWEVINPSPIPGLYLEMSSGEAASDRGQGPDKKKKLDMAVGKRRRMTYCSCEEPNFDQTSRERRATDLAKGCRGGGISVPLLDDAPL